MKMSAKENGLEVKVGLFMCIGLAIIGAMVLEFSLGGKQGFKKYESFYVDLPDAAGLLKGSEVLLAGSNIGFVADKPRLSSSLSTVRVTLKIDEKVKIPIGSTFKVASSGLLGDKYVSVQMGANFDSSKFNSNDPKQVYQPVDATKPDLNAKIYNPSDPKANDPDYPGYDEKLSYKPGDVILGEGAQDLTEIAANASKQLTGALTDFKEILTTLKTGVLSQESLKNLQDTFASFKSISQNWADASQHLPPLAKSAQETVDKANASMATIHDAAENLRVTLATARDLMDKASHGEGLIGQLINNHQLADNFNALITNMRIHGPVFYHDTTKNAQPTPTPAPPRDKKQH